MKISNEAAVSVTDEKTLFINPLIKHLISAIHYCSIAKGILIINDVSPDLKSGSDVNTLTLVLGNLIKDAISYSENDCIRISSTDSGEIIISSKKSNLGRNRSFLASIDSLQLIAQRSGSPVSISGSFTNGTEIFVRFNKNAV
ncbi:MAG TPA: hypothetical protein VI548_09195 [Chitinophagaceae bacterium]|nr:hypothetical protein [Chitinophagaceae bacterium]